MTNHTVARRRRLPWPATLVAGAWAAWQLLTCRGVPSAEYELAPSLSGADASMQPVWLGDDARSGDELTGHIVFRRRTVAVEPACYFVLSVCSWKSWLEIDENAAVTLTLDGSESPLEYDPLDCSGDRHWKDRGDLGLYYGESVRVVLGDRALSDLVAARYARVSIHGAKREARCAVHPNTLRAIQSFVRDHRNG